MDINHANLETLFQAIDMRFKASYNAEVSDTWKKLCTVFPMGTESIKFPLLDQIAGMRKWVGPRVINHIASKAFAVAADDYEITYAMPRNAILDDTYGLYVALLDQIAVEAARLPENVITALINGAATATWKGDGALVFGTTRKYGENTIANKGTSALSASAVKSVITAMKSYKGQGDAPMGVKPAVLVHGPALDWTAKDILESPFIGTNGDPNPNPLYHALEDVSLPKMTGSSWLVLARGPVNAIGYFERQAPNALVAKDDPKDEHVFSNKEFLYGADGRVAAEWLLPHLAYLNVVA